MTDFDTWLQDFGYYHILRMLELRRPGQYTPYEMEQKFSDESLYRSNFYIKIRIKEAIELPNGDVLIGYNEVDEDDDRDADKLVVYYKRLSEIELTYFPDDDNIENWE